MTIIITDISIYNLHLSSCFNDYSSFMMINKLTNVSYFQQDVFFITANASAAAGGIIFFLSYIPYSFLSPRYDTLSAMTKLVSCLDLNMAMSFGINLISRFEGAGTLVKP